LSLFCAGISLAAHITQHVHDHHRYPRAELVDMDHNEIMPRQDGACTNGPASRGCWGGRFSIATNYDADWPNTGKVVKYTIEVQNRTDLAPDGVQRLVMAINGTYPGPTLRANWGDTLQITVVNKLQVNGTSMHWHGLRQWKTNTMVGDLLMIWTNSLQVTGRHKWHYRVPFGSRSKQDLHILLHTIWYHLVSLSLLRPVNELST
jgi:hypothetical protein